MTKKDKQNGFSIIELIIILAVVAVVGGAGYYVFHSKNTSKTSSASSKATLNITSEPNGIQMNGTPLCDGAKLHKLTSYTCAATNSDLDTVITAPAQTSINGKAYTFQTWDGCSASNANKAICKVHVDSGKSKTLKASYIATATAVSRGNDQTCTISEETAFIFSSGGHEGFTSTNGKDTICTLHEPHLAAGSTLQVDAKYDVSTIDCGADCSNYKEDPVIFHRLGVPINGFSLLCDANTCQNPNQNQDFGHGYSSVNEQDQPMNLLKPTTLHIKTNEEFNINFNCTDYLCAVRNSFQGWSTSIDSGGSSTAPMHIHVVAKYKLVKIVDAHYANSSTNRYPYFP